jgi:AcrR family transcriptional regulator
MPCDWIGIVTIRSDTRTSRSITGMIRARPRSFTPTTLPSRNNTPLVLRHDLYRQRQPDHPTVIYRHVPNKAAVLDGVAEIVLGQLRVDTADPDWTAQLRAVAHDFRRLALAHPNVVPLLVTRPLATPLGRRPLGMLRPLEDVLALLTSAGFSGADALHIYRVLFGYLYGHILTELQEVIERPEETDDVLRLGLHRLTVTEFPRVRALASALANYDGAAELDRGLDLLLLGLTATLTPPDAPSRS